MSDLVGDTQRPSEPSAMGSNRFLARQPILDRQGRVFAYELLFRSGWMDCFEGEHDDATRQMLDNVLVSGADALSSQTLAFVNCTRDSLVRGLVTLLPPATTVLEILETVEPDDEVIAACRNLKKKGYRLALDDFVLRDGMQPLIDLADFIKIDFRASDAAERRKIRAELQGSHAALLAEKVEDEAEFQIALGEGYHYFQGYFFCRPTMVARREVPASQLCGLRLLSVLSRSPVKTREVEQVVMADASLSYRLLRMVNSPLYAMRKPIESIGRALVIVGENEFRKLALVAMSAGLSKRPPHALLLLALQRARFCELAAHALDGNPGEQYLLGLLSVVDAILQLPMTTVVQSLPLRPEARAALLGEKNDESRGLRAAHHFETGTWAREDDPGTHADCTDLTGLYAQSVRWANQELTSHIA